MTASRRESQWLSTIQRQDVSVCRPQHQRFWCTFSFIVRLPFSRGFCCKMQGERLIFFVGSLLLQCKIHNSGHLNQIKYLQLTTFKNLSSFLARVVGFTWVFNRTTFFPPWRPVNEMWLSIGFRPLLSPLSFGELESFMTWVIVGRLFVVKTCCIYLSFFLMELL